ncbi:sigma-70 family RNA polymerase sigma factor [Sediminibacterium sp.]|uniref:sigma-70 family RNA polymerase sigma factor n=1 Tax=Sediminibacterium sp. TaxID=1917865 RepID=UPI0025E84FFD|nr:sigma-70 family RNA polymerase sigma factor [Sediminibacterium sp.]MBT9484482.1 sigma-70 family RNA polymerase sigma factor [Sediminibacterium sp.]
MTKQVNKADPQNWLQQYGDLLYQYTLPRVNDSVIAEDLVQETFLSALKGLDGYKGEASEKNWLFTILKNKIIDHYRKKSSGLSVMSMPDLQGADGGWFDEEGSWVENRMPKDWDAADKPLERKEIQKIINWCKDHLKELQQHVFTLKYMEDLDSIEICKILNISSSNYWVLIHRARLKMRDCVEKHRL